MAEIQSIAFTQTQNLSYSKSISASYERGQAVASVGASGSAPVDGFEGIFDVVDISEDAQQQLLQDRADAENLAAYVQGERAEVLSAPLVIRNGRVEINALAAQISEQFSISESYEVRFTQETTLDIETDQGSFSITQTRLAQASYSASVGVERDAGFGSVQAALSV